MPKSRPTSARPIPTHIAAEIRALACDGAAVIALRSARLARGGAPARGEVALMVREKVEAGVRLWGMALTGQLGWHPAAITLNTLRFYRKGVRANRRRLERG